MDRRVLTPALPLILGLLLSACNWVDLTPEGESVMVREASAVSSCERIGRVTARTRDEIARVDRGAETLQNELLVLARNEAGNLGGDTIVPDSVIQDGTQVFNVYNCP